jgi:hypothetical protein
VDLKPPGGPTGNAGTARGRSRSAASACPKRRARIAPVASLRHKAKPGAGLAPKASLQHATMTRQGVPVEVATWSPAVWTEVKDGAAPPWHRTTQDRDTQIVSFESSEEDGCALHPSPAPVVGMTPTAGLFSRAFAGSFCELSAIPRLPSRTRRTRVRPNADSAPPMPARRTDGARHSRRSPELSAEEKACLPSLTPTPSRKRP